ncbi:hypothetical protein D3C79_790730 [compost metagenome]
MVVVLIHGIAQTLWIDATGARQRFDGPGGFQVARGNEWLQRQRIGAGHAEAIAALKGVAANQPGLDLLTGCLGDHGADVVVVAIGFVDEAFAVGQYADDAGFAALDDVREMADCAVLVRHP